MQELICSPDLFVVQGEFGLLLLAIEEMV